MKQPATIIAAPPFVCATANHPIWLSLGSAATLFNAIPTNPVSNSTKLDGSGTGETAWPLARKFTDAAVLYVEAGEPLLCACDPISVVNAFDRRLGQIEVNTGAGLQQGQRHNVLVFGYSR
jgi:hypothetical protein